MNATPTEPRQSLAISPAQVTVLVVGLVCLFFIVNFYDRSLDSYRIYQRAAQVKRVNARLEEEIKQWQQLVDQLSTEAYVETTAREKLNLVRAGDRSLVIMSATPEVATVAGPPPVREAQLPLREYGHVADWIALFLGPRL